MGPALRGTLVAGADADARWHLDPPDEGDPARGSNFPVDRQRLPALRLRYVDGPGVPGCLVRTLRGRCGGPLRDRASSPPGVGGDRPSARRHRAAVASRQDAAGVLQGLQTSSGLRSGEVYVLWVHVPSPGSLRQGPEKVLHGLPAGGGPGEADRHEPQGSVLAAASTHHSNSGRPRRGCEPGPSGLAELLHRVLSERGDPHRQAYGSPSDALGEVEIQAAGTRRQTGTGMVEGSPETVTRPVRALGAAVLKP